MTASPRPSSIRILRCRNFLGYTLPMNSFWLFLGVRWFLLTSGWSILNRLMAILSLSSQSVRVLYVFLLTGGFCILLILIKRQNCYNVLGLVTIFKQLFLPICLYNFLVVAYNVTLTSAVCYTILVFILAVRSNRKK